MRDDFFTSYLHYTRNNEVPTFFHRWSAIAGLGALLGRNYSLRFGHQTLQPNIYCMLLGSPGTRKSTAIKIMKSLLVQSGYEHLAADKSTKEKFLLDLSGAQYDDKGKLIRDVLAENIFGDAEDESTAPPREMFIAADEFNDFFGNGNIEFISLLGTLWDYEGVYKNRIKNGISVSIPHPTVSILGGNTPTGFALAFPSEILGQGFFSRILLIYGESSGKKIAFPVPPTIDETNAILRQLANIRMNAIGLCSLEASAEKLLTKIYTSWKGIDDVRFESYSNRRFTHLLKLCLIHSASRQIQDTQGNVSTKQVITEQDVIYANTVLVHTERFMPRALGEFGKSKHSDVSHKIMQVVEKAEKPLTLQEIYKHIDRDVTVIEVQTLIKNLQVAQKLQSTGTGYLPIKTMAVEFASDEVDFSFLTEEERKLGE